MYYANMNVRLGNCYRYVTVMLLQYLPRNGIGACK